MQLRTRLASYGLHAYFLGFFFILYFKHGQIDLVRFPFFVFIVWQIFKKKLTPGFLIDPISICIAVFILAATISNLINAIQLDEIVKIINWLFPFFLGKYAINLKERIKIETIFLYLLVCATLFSLIGLVGQIFNLDAVFGIALFDSGHRYRFTISGTNRAGFCLGVTLVLTMYFFVRDDLSIKKRTVLPLVCWLIVFAALFIIKERKTILMIGLMLALLLLIYRHYKILSVVAVATGLLLAVVPLPERYQIKQIVRGDIALYGRLNVWEGALGLFKQKPVFGHGYPSFKKAHQAYYQENSATYRFKKFMDVSMAHNLSLNALAETGILGFVALNGIFFSAWRFYRYTRSDPLLFIVGCAVCFIYVTMQFGNFVHSATRTDMSFFVIGLFWGMESHFHKGRARVGKSAQSPRQSAQFGEQPETRRP